MATKELHVLAIDGGGTTGYSRITVPRLCIFGDEDPQIWEWDYGEFTGPISGQTIAIVQLARQVQGLAYKTGPAVVAERWDPDPSFKSRDEDSYSPVYVNAQLQLMFERFPKLVGDATLHFQSRTQAFKAFTDQRLQDRDMYVAGSTHIRAATKHALTALRRARESAAFAHALWPYPPSGLH